MMDEMRRDWQGLVRPLVWLGAAILILLPLVVLKIASPDAWDPADLPFAFVFIAAVGLAFEFALRVPAAWTYRAGAALGLGTACLLTWGNLAVGFAGSEDNAVNIILFAVPIIALAGTIAALGRPAGASRAMAGAALAQFVAGLIALAYGHFTGPLTVSLTGLWLAASLSFFRSSRECPTVRSGA